MKNVTLAMDETLLEQARGLAERRKTTLNALIRSLLAHEVEQEDRIAWAQGRNEAGSWTKLAQRSDSADTRLQMGSDEMPMPTEKIDCFLDTNVLIYAASERNRDPRRHANRRKAWCSSTVFGVSGQTLAEFAAMSRGENHVACR